MVFLFAQSGVKYSWVKFNAMQAPACPVERCERGEGRPRQVLRNSAQTGSIPTCPGMVSWSGNVVQSVYNTQVEWK